MGHCTPASGPGVPQPPSGLAWTLGPWEEGSPDTSQVLGIGFSSQRGTAGPSRSVLQTGSPRLGHRGRKPRVRLSPKTSGLVTPWPLCPQSRPHKDAHACPSGVPANSKSGGQGPAFHRLGGEECQSPHSLIPAPLGTRGLRPRWFRPNSDVSPGCKHSSVPSQPTCAHTHTGVPRLTPTHPRTTGVPTFVDQALGSPPNLPTSVAVVRCMGGVDGEGGTDGRRVLGGWLEEQREEMHANTPTAG